LRCKRFLSLPPHPHSLSPQSLGFHNRNTSIAKSDYIIAFTWGKEQPEAGGTLDTWKKACGEKVHVSLGELEAEIITKNESIPEGGICNKSNET
jgi:hypothetical protein